MPSHGPASEIGASPAAHVGARMSRLSSGGRSVRSARTNTVSSCPTGTTAIDGGTPGSSATLIGPPPSAGSCPPVSSQGGMIALPSIRPGTGETFTIVPAYVSPRNLTR